MRSDIFTSFLSFNWRGFFVFILIQFSSLSLLWFVQYANCKKKESQNHDNFLGSSSWYVRRVGYSVLLLSLTKLIWVSLTTIKKIKIFVVEKYQFLYKFLSLIVDKDTIFYNLPAAIQSWHRHITVFLFCLHQRDFEWNQPGLE